MFCPSCGTSLSEEAPFCLQCGTLTPRRNRVSGEPTPVFAPSSSPSDPYGSRPSTSYGPVPFEAEPQSSYAPLSPSAPSSPYVPLSSPPPPRRRRSIFPGLLIGLLLALLLLGGGIGALLFLKQQKSPAAPSVAHVVKPRPT